jgi:hypothetical protein
MKRTEPPFRNTSVAAAGGVALWSSSREGYAGLSKEATAVARF